MKKRAAKTVALTRAKEMETWQPSNKKRRITRLILPIAQDVAKIRHKFGLSQRAFAALMGVSVATLRNWEQGRCEPHGSAKNLLLIAKKLPEVFLRNYKI